MGQAYQDARLAARYTQGRRAEAEQDWAGAIAHYQAVVDAQPGYRDVAAPLADATRRRDIAALQEQLRALFTAGQFQAVVGIAGRLAELDPAAADPDNLATTARQQLAHTQQADAMGEPVGGPGGARIDSEPRFVGQRLGQYSLWR